MFKKIAIVLGRGIEGCGVTKFSLEQSAWLCKNGYICRIYASKDKLWNRRNAHQIENLTILKFSNDQEMAKMIQECNDSDLIIINSLPSIGHPEKCIQAFKSALERFSKPVVLIQHDHLNHSLRRNALLEESTNKADVLFALSRTNDYSEFVKKLTSAESESSLDAFLEGGTTITPTQKKNIMPFQPGLSFDEIRKRYWLPIEAQDPLQNKWIGRTTSWKGYDLMFKFHNQHLRAGGYITTFEGIEKSPAYMDFRTLSEFHPMITSDPDLIKTEPNQPAYVFGPYNNERMLHRLAKCGFGYQLSRLGARFVESAIEYTHCETVCSGVVPVFRKQFGDNCTHRLIGDKLTACKNSGTIWLDDNDMQPAYNLLDKLARDSIMRNEYREMAYAFYKDHQDSAYVFQDLFRKIQNVMTDKNNVQLSRTMV